MNQTFCIYLILCPYCQIEKYCKDVRTIFGQACRRIKNLAGILCWLMAYYYLLMFYVVSCSAYMLGETLAGVGIWRTFSGQYHCKVSMNPQTARFGYNVQPSVLIPIDQAA